MDNQKVLEAIKALSNKLDDYIKSSNKKFDQLAKVLDLVYEQGDVVEDVSINTGAAIDEIKYLKENVQKFTKDIKAGILEVGYKVDNITDKIN